MIRRRTHKYHAKQVEHDGIKFPSEAEGAYYKQLKLEKACGQVVFFLRQVPFHLPGETTYRVDFMEFRLNGEIRFVDVKGHLTKEFVRAKKQVEALYPVVIEVVKMRKRKGRVWFDDITKEVMQPKDKT